MSVLLSSNRALSDARRGHQRLKAQYESGEILFSEWRVQWIGVCALLRASVHLFQTDSRACLNSRISEELSREWKNIKEYASDHEIYWQFINMERNAVLKEYHWTAYEAYIDELGAEIPSTKVGIFNMVDPKITKKLKINSGEYKGEDALDVLGKAVFWAEERLSAALERAGFAWADKVHFLTWKKMPEIEKQIPSNSLLTLVDRDDVPD